MKLTVIGGGGVRSMFLAKSIAQRAEELHIDELVFMDNDPEKLRIYGGLAAHVARMLCPTMKFTLTSSAEEAVTDADYVITTIRVGGDATRVRDERLALDLGILGQETTGAAGVSFAMRSIPALAEYCELIKKLADNGSIFYSSTGDLVSKFELGEVSVAVCQDFDASTIRAAKEGLEYVIVPEEGSYLGINQVNITKSCKNPELAYKFISWLISYDVQYEDALARVEAPANTKVELTEEQADGMCYGDAVKISSAPNWALYSERNDAWILRYNEEIYQ